MQLQHIRIHAKALKKNLQFLRALAPQSRFMAVVKANAYGHGLDAIVALLKGEVDFFGVNSVAEAIALRRIDSMTPLLVMGGNGLELDELPQAQEALGDADKLHFVLSDKESLRAFLKESPRPYRFHLKLDTGLGRLGFLPHELGDCMDWLSSKPEGALRWAGLMSHFANVEDVLEQNYAQKQLKCFLKLSKTIAHSTYRRLLFHSAASSASMLLPASRLSMIRIGISLYGLWPSEKVRLAFLKGNTNIEAEPLHPVLSWHSAIAHTKELALGSYVGYGCSFQAPKAMRIAVVPVGYYEGYDRLFSHQSYVLVHGQRAPVLGRVSMNMICIDISSIPQARRGDELSLLGEEKGADTIESVSADDLAKLASTINYEFVCRIHPAIPRIVVQD